ncbi:MAG: 30S ribosomal protein S9 [Candidatus Colwellbacteria bacterium]|nr:30S ribosomal protein S9 [Candidatus Colwellbacteria bacterium]
MTDAKNQEKYFEGLGRRKTARARVRFYPAAAKSQFTVNEKPHNQYFPLKRLENRASAPLKLVSDAKFVITVRVQGGGPTAQAEAITLGLSRALVKFRPEIKAELRAFGFLTRDSRMVERKKYGLKKARRAPQWRKR